MLELRQIKYFLVLAQELNFSRAAERLFITQPPLTRQIQQLEEHLGVQLFLRNNKSVTLTVAGKSVLEEAQKIMVLVHESENRTRLVNDGKVGLLNIGIFGSAIFNDIPQLLLTFRTRYPEVNIGLYQMSKAEQIHALRTNQITIGFNRRLPVEQDIMVETVYFEPLIVAIHANSELAQYERIHCQHLQGKPIILYPNATRPSFADTVIAFLRDNHVDVQYTQEAPDVVTALALVSSGFGACITPESASRLSLPNVLYRKIDIEPQPTVELACLYRRGDDNPVLHNFLDVIRHYKHQDI